MMRQHRFYGSATVGERGQIVLPAELRKAFDIRRGDKLLVIGHEHGRNILLFKAEAMDELLGRMSEDIAQMRSEIRKRGD